MCILFKKKVHFILKKCAFYFKKKCAFYLKKSAFYFKKNAILCLFLKNILPSKRLICFILKNLHFPMVDGITFYALHKSSKTSDFSLFIGPPDEI